jgi:hypothetical protein
MFNLFTKQRNTIYLVLNIYFPLEVYIFRVLCQPECSCYWCPCCWKRKTEVSCNQFKLLKLYLKCHIFHVTNQSVSNNFVTWDVFITSVSTPANVLVTSDIMILIISMTHANIIWEIYVTTDYSNICNFFARFSEIWTSDQLHYCTFSASLTVTPCTYILTQDNINMIWHTGTC